MMQGWRVCYIGCALAMASTHGVGADVSDYPRRPIRMVVSGVGGTGDFSARLIGPHLTAKFGQPVVVDNRPGGVVPGQILAEAPADGHTLMMAGEVIWLSPFMRESVPFDPVRDFAPLMLAIRSPNVLVVHPSLPVTSVQELVRYAKQRPGTLNAGSSGIGNSNHLAGAIFNAMAGVDIQVVPYKGAQLAMNDLLGGRLQLMFATVNSSGGHVAAGKLRAIAVTSSSPSRLVPGMPTVASAGLPGYESAAKIGLFARAGTSPAILDIVHREVAAFLRQPDTVERMFKAGVEVVANSPQEFAEAMRTEMKVKGRIIREAGIRMN